MMDTDQLLISRFFKDHQDLAISHIEGLKNEVVISLVEELNLAQNSLLFTKFNVYRAAQILEKISVEKAGKIIAAISLLAAQRLLRIVQKEQREAILNQLNPENATTLRRGLEYPKDRVGAHIEPFVHTLSSQMSIEKGLASINSSTANVQPHFFVLDDHKRLKGYVDLNDLIQGENHLRVKSKLRPIKQPAHADMSAVDLLDHWDHNMVCLPVIDVEGIFIGSVSRAVLTEISDRTASSKGTSNAAIRAGNALGDLYMIGLTSLLGSPTDSDNKA